MGRSLRFLNAGWNRAKKNRPDLLRPGQIILMEIKRKTSEQQLLPFYLVYSVCQFVSEMVKNQGNCVNL